MAYGHDIAPCGRVRGGLGVTITVAAERDTAPDADPVSARAKRRWYNGASRWALGIAAVSLAGLLGVWSQRNPIANNYIESYLADHGVKARYQIADIGFNTQRLTGVVIGDPTRPDLVADWVEVSTQIGLNGATVTGLRAGAVRLRGALVDGKLMLGSLDRLMPASRGGPFTLPSIDLDIVDGRMQLTAPQGVIGIKLAGQGRLDNGWSGRAALISERLTAAGCTADRLAANWAVQITDRQPRLIGPLRVATIVCGSTRASGAAITLDARLDARFDRWQGKAAVSLAALQDPAARVEALSGVVEFDGSAASTRGGYSVQSGPLLTSALKAEGGTLVGRYQVSRQGSDLQGHASLTGASMAPALRTMLSGWRGGAGGTPLAPLVDRLVRAAVMAGSDMTVGGDVALVSNADILNINLSVVEARSASGVLVTLNRGDGVDIGPDGVRLNGTLAIAGGGLPEAVIQLAQNVAGSPITGSGIVRPYAAGGAALSLTNVDFTAASSGATRLSTVARLSGPIGSGRIDGARLALQAEWDGHRRWRINRACSPLSFDRLTIGSLVLGSARLQLCPTGEALMSVNGSTMSGGGRVAAPTLAGALGGSPLSLSVASARFGVSARDFQVAGLAARLGDPDRITRLDIGSLQGKLLKKGANGRFADGAGHVARVPLLMSGSEGNWQFDGHRLAITGSLIVADDDADPRFFPLASKDVSFTLADNRIIATAGLAHPETGTSVTTVSIAHDLGNGIGHADLEVPGISFDEALQPLQLTRFTKGVIAEVKGVVSGSGQVRWTRDGVKSDGVFRTTGTDLAAAFGPVTGLSGEIRFTDLLNLESAPGQVATIAIVNPGIPVTEGVVRYQTLPGSRVAVEGGRWPFAGGTLVLEPSVLDFTESKERRMTFRVEGVNAAQFLQQFDFKNLDATGTFDGVLPMIFDEQGGRIENGRLTVRETGGTIAYVGELSQEDLGFWGNMAFQALKSLKYKTLAIEMNGPLAGEMITEVRFAGISQGAATKSNFLIRRLQKLPLVFNVRIQAPFRQLIDSAQSYYDPRRLIERNLPDLIRAQNKGIRDRTVPAIPPSKTQADQPVQPPASEPMP